MLILKSQDRTLFSVHGQMFQGTEASTSTTANTLDLAVVQFNASLMGEGGENVIVASAYLPGQEMRQYHKCN